MSEVEWLTIVLVIGGALIFCLGVFVGKYVALGGSAEPSPHNPDSADHKRNA